MSQTADDADSQVNQDWASARSQLFRMIMEGRSFSGRERNCCFLNTGGKRFATVSAISGFDFIDDGRGIAVTDWDSDGDLDMWISNRNAPRLRLMRNDLVTPNHFLRMRLVGNGETSNRDAVGARVQLFVKSPANDSDVNRTAPMSRTLRAGEGFISQSSKWLHFGLGQEEVIDRVTVSWPGGETESYSGLSVDTSYRIQQGNPTANPVAVDRHVDLTATEQTLPPVTRKARIALQTRLQMPPITFQKSDGTSVTEPFTGGKPTLINLWASWCQPCLAELTEFSQQQQAIEQGGLQIIALSVDQLGENPTSPTVVRSLIEKLEFPFTWGEIDDTQMEQLQQLHDQLFYLNKPLPLPTSFLVDDQGRLSAIYRGPVSPEQVLADAHRQPNNYHENLLQAACVPGHTIDHPHVHQVAQQFDRQSKFQGGMWFEDIGLNDHALRQYTQLATENPTWSAPFRRLAYLLMHRGDLGKATDSALRAVDIEPKDAGAHSVLGDLFTRQGDRRRAEYHLREAIRLDDQIAEAHNNLGSMLASKGQLAAAGASFQRAIDIDDKMAEAHINLGSVYAARGDLSGAIRHYREAIEIDSTLADPYNNLGSMYARQNKLDLAIECFAKALQLEPNNPDAQRNLERARQLKQQRQRP